MKNKKLDFAMIGSGRVASVLAPAFENAGHRCVAVHSLNENHAKKLAAKLYDCHVLSEPDFSEIQTDVILIAISDDAVTDLVDEMIWDGTSVVAHTSGGLGISTLSRFGDKAGVFYPVQSFSANRKVNLSEVPICIEAKSKDTEVKLIQLASSLTGELYYLDSSQRSDLHIAAVFASNFSNFMLSCAWEYMHKKDMNTDMLLPLIQETFNKALDLDPRKVQTGPAIRGDQQVMQQHLGKLSDLPDLQRLYLQISGSIQDFYRPIKQ